MTDDLASVKARLRADTYTVPTPDGALVHTNRGTETFTGDTIHRWITTLAPRLSGRTTVGALVRGLPKDKTEMVVRILDALRDRGLVRDGGATAPERPEIAYLDSFVPDAAASYRAYQRAHVVAVGRGPIYDEVRDLLTRSGAGAVTALGGGYGDLLPALDEPADLVVHVAGRPGPVAASLVDQVCRDRGVPVVHAVPCAGELWIHAGTGWSAGWRRARRWLDTNRPADPGTVPVDADPGAGTVPTDAVPAADAVALAASMIAMAAFRLLTGVADPDRADTMTCFDLASLGTTTHRFLPWPAAPARPAGERSFLDGIRRLAAAPPVDPVALDGAGVRLADPRLGVFGEVSERDFAQLPLNVAAVTVPGRAEPVTGAGLTVVEARWRAVMAGLAAYAVSTVDPDRLAAGRVWGWRPPDGPTDRPEPGEAPRRPGAVGGTACLLDAARVFGAPDADIPGVAAAYRWCDAVTAGLLDWCARLTASAGPARPVRLDPASLDPDREAAAYLRMIGILDVPLRVYDVTGPLRVPTLAFQVAARTVAYASGRRGSDALPAGLRAVLLDHQATADGQPAYAPAPVPPLPVPAGTSAATVAPTAPLTQRDLVAALRRAGYGPVVVPLDHDPELRRLVPYLVRVVLDRA